MVGAPGYRRGAHRYTGRTGVRSLQADGGGLAGTIGLARALAVSGAIQIGPAIRACRSLLASASAATGSGLTTCGSSTRRVSRPGVLLRARRPIALAALASGASARTTNLEGSIQVVRAFLACTLHPGTAGGTSRLLRAAGVPIAGRGLGTKGVGRGTGVGAVAGIGCQCRTRA